MPQKNSVVTEQEVLFKKREPVYNRSVKGTFRSIKTSILILAYSVYFLLPFLRWERVGDVSDQAVLFDIVGRKFYLFDLVIYAQDIFWLAGFLIIAAMLLFFVTGIAGRIFCGYFCFQTLWTDMVMMIEHWVQGDRNARIKLAKQPWNKEKVLKLGITYSLFFVLAFLTSLSFVLYWGDAFELTQQIFTATAPTPAYVTITILTISTYVMAVFAREQVCHFICPYARFQSVMFDQDTVIVAYDEQRGEGIKGRHKPLKEYKTREERQQQGVGDCIDCGLCVQVCPVGIDIRDGLQLECIHCALCIDACNNMMDKIGYPKGLIRYSSENELLGEKQTNPWLKGKSLAYASVIIITIAALVWSVWSREPFEVVITQVRQPLYVVLSNGDVQNNYEVKFTNKSKKEAEYQLTLDNFPDAMLDMGEFKTIVLPPEKSVLVRLHIHINPELVNTEKQKIVFLVKNIRAENESIRVFNYFILPPHVFKE